MIKRIWHGWTTHQDADRYEQLLLNEIIPMIEGKNMSGYQGIEVLRREHDVEVEFITIMSFESLGHIEAFVGEDVTVAHVPAAAQTVLSRWDEHSQHYEVRRNP